MTVYQYVIAQEASRLMLESEKRELTEEEEELLTVLIPAVERFQREERRCRG